MSPPNLESPGQPGLSVMLSQNWRALPMADLKRIIEEEKRRNREKENAASDRFRNSRAFQEDRSNDSKAQKLLGFAGSVLKRFERETGLHFEYIGTHSNYGNCLGCYGFFRYESGFLFSKKYRAGEVIIGLRGHKSSVGYISGSVLNFGGTDVGARVEFEDITEEWFMRMLAQHYANLL